MVLSHFARESAPQPEIYSSVAKRARPPPALARLARTSCSTTWMVPPASDSAHDAHPTVHPPHIMLDTLEVAIGVYARIFRGRAPTDDRLPKRLVPLLAALVVPVMYPRPAVASAGDAKREVYLRRRRIRLAGSRWRGQQRTRSGPRDVLRVKHRQALMSDEAVHTDHASSERLLPVPAE